MNQNFVKGAVVSRVMNSVAAGTTSQNSSIIDMSCYDDVTFVAHFGALTAGQITSLKVQGGTLSNGSDMADISGATAGPLADSDGNKTLIVEVFRPQFRYVRAVVVRGTQNAVIDGVDAIVRMNDKMPVSQDSTNSATTLVVF